MNKKELSQLSEITSNLIILRENVADFVEQAIRLECGKNPFANIERVDFVDAASNNSIRLLDELKSLVVEYRMSHGYTVYTE